MTKSEQVDVILQDMLQGNWAGAKSNERYAKEWGCHPRTVSDRACEASAVLERLGGPMETFVRQKLAEIDADIDAARKDGNWNAVMKGHELQAKIKGALVQRHEHKDVTKLPDEELKARLKAALDEAEERTKATH